MRPQKAQMIKETPMDPTWAVIPPGETKMPEPTMQPTIRDTASTTPISFFKDTPPSAIFNHRDGSL